MSELDKPYVLVVDDVPANVKALGAALENEFHVVAATDGEGCLQRAVAEPVPDLILLDVMMPEMDGFEVCRRLKADPRTVDIPIIFLTSMDDRGNEAEGFEAGAVDYVTKPFSLPVVKARISVHIELREHRAFLEKALSEQTKDLKRAQNEILRMLRRR